MNLPGRLEQALRVPAGASTLAGFRRWVTGDDFPEDLSATYFQGELFLDMSPERLGSHNAVKMELGRVLGDLTKKADLGKWFPDGMLLTNHEADFATEPDSMFVAWETVETGRVQLVASADGLDVVEVWGTPDLVVEVVSPSSVTKDNDLLRDGYHRAGIPEYWLIDARGDDLRFDILERTPADYQAVPPRAGWIHSAVFGRELQLSRQRDRIGQWDYELQLQPTPPRK